MNHINYSYYIKSSKWREKRKTALKATGYRCVLFPFLEAKEVHHLNYKNLGKEQVCIDIIPLSKTSHRIVHLWGLKKGTKSLWVKFWGILLRLLFPFAVVIGLLFPVKKILR